MFKAPQMLEMGMLPEASEGLGWGHGACRVSSWSMLQYIAFSTVQQWLCSPVPYLPSPFQAYSDRSHLPQQPS